MAIDPICGMQVDEATQFRAQFGGQTYYFCCEGCRQKFARDPGAALHPRPPAADAGLVSLSFGPPPTAPLPPPSALSPPSSSSTSALSALPRMSEEVGGEPEMPGAYICPMCPEVRSDRPGPCPKCGMALEPERFTGAPEDTSELDSMARRLAVAVIGTIPLFILAMGPMLLGQPHNAWLGQAGPWVQLLLASFVLLGAGWPILARGVHSVATGHLNMFTLITLGTLAAYLFSVVAVIAPQQIPAAFYEHGAPPLYFESAAMIMALVLLGQVLELRARRRTGDAIRELLALTPPVAHLIESTGEIDVPLDHVCVGAVLRVRPGEKVPVDGVVRDGHSQVNEALVTGEPMPVTKSPGDTVIGGTLNEVGTLTIEAARVGQDTMLSRIVQLVAQAQRSRAPIQQLTDTVANWFVPLVVISATVTFAIWSACDEEQGVARGLVSAVSVLIIACPCALGLATPMSIMVGMGVAARRGVLIRNAEVLQRMARIDTIAFDKTGTLTEGRPEVAAAHGDASHKCGDVLRWAAAVEQPSEHPLARAIVAAAKTSGIHPPVARDFLASPGEGAQGLVDGKRVRVGTWSYVTAGAARRQTLEESPWWIVTDTVRTMGQTVVFVGVDDVVVGFVALADPIKAQARDAIETLRNEQMSLQMLTGDNASTARTVAKRLGIQDVFAELTPAGKIDTVRRQRAAGRRVAMVGDGVNDAPALAAADVGIAMGTGSDVAIESAGITLLRGDLRGVVDALRLSRAVVRNIRQNLFFAFLYNILGIPLAAGVLVPLYGITLNPMIAAAAMSFSSVSVISNALRLRRVRL